MTARGIWLRGVLAFSGVALGLGTVALSAAPAGAYGTQSVVPVLNCSYKTSTGMYNIEFGYRNPNSSAVTVAIGSSNEFTSGGLPENSGQPTTFQAGTHTDVFIVTAQQDVDWTLDGTKVTSPGSSCSSNPGPGPWYGSAVVFPILTCDFLDTGTGQTNSVFGYTNPFSTTETQAVGSSNAVYNSQEQIIPGGEPSSFAPGTTTSSFVVTHTTAVAWYVTGSYVYTPAASKCSSNPVPIVSGHTGSLVVLGLFGLGGVLAFVLVRRRRWLRQLVGLSS